MLLSLLLACSDYGIKPKPEVTDVSMGLAVEPASIDLVSCGASDQVVRLDSTGTAAVEITALTLSGEGWTMEPVDLPLSIPGGESVDLQLSGSNGEAVLFIETSLPDLSVIEVPLRAAPDAPPTVSILSPADGDVLASGTSLELRAEARDDVDGADTLAVSWESDVDGLISTTPPAADGAILSTWEAADRQAGPHTLTLTVTDSCGNSGSDSLSLCQDEGYTVDELDIASWHVEGVASWSEADTWLELTPNVLDSVGTAFAIDETVPGDAVSIAFRFYIGDGTGADGISLTMLDSSRMTTFLGGTGCGIGYGGDASCTAGPALPGWSIEVDTHFNEGQDPTADDHVMFTFDGDVDDPIAWAPLPEMEDTGWHLMEVEVGGGRVQVWIDGAVYIDASVTGFSPFPGYVGFTAGTGGLTNRHLIDSLEVTAHTCE